MVSPFAIENPILTKELRTRMRGAKSFWILFLYLGILATVLATTYFFWWQNEVRTNDGGAAAFQVGRQFYGVIFAVQAALVGLITPALTSGALSIEREQRTFEALIVSPLSRRSIVLGKLVSAVAFVGLLLVGSLPLVSLCFLLGGVSPAEIGSGYFLLLVAAFLYGAVGIAFSSFAKATTTATVLTYGMILLLFFSTLPFTLDRLEFASAGFRGQVHLVALNPIGAMAVGGVTENYFGLSLPGWLTALSVNGLLGVILTLVAMHRVEYPRSDRTPLLRGLTALFVLLMSFYVCGAIHQVNGALNDYYFTPSNTVGIRLFVIALPFLFVPLFVTGDSLPEDNVRRRFFQLRSGQPLSGFTYVLLLVAVGSVFAFPAILGTENGLALLPLAMATAFGFGGLALLLTQRLKNRWGTLAIVATTMLAAYLLPLTSLTRNSSDESYSPTVNMLYLSPAYAVHMGVTEPGTVPGNYDVQKVLVFGIQGLVPICTVFYTGLGTICLILVGAGRRKK